MYHLAVTIAKKTLDKNRLKNAQKTTDCTPPSFQVGDRIYLKNEQPGKLDLKWRAGYRIVHIQFDGHWLHIKNQGTGKSLSYNVKDVVHEPPVKLRNIDTQFGRVGISTNHPAICLLSSSALINYHKKKEEFY